MAQYPTTRRSKKRGLSPGTLVHIGLKHEGPTRLQCLHYSEGGCEERTLSQPEECFAYRDSPGTTWLNIDGLHDVELIEKIGKHYGLHPLVLEDIVNTEQRPKLQEFEEYVFIVLRGERLDGTSKMVRTEQISLVLGKNFVLTFQEDIGDLFDPVRERLRQGKGRIRKEGPGYLGYALVDAVVDGYFAVLERFGDEIERLEQGILRAGTPETLRTIHELKRELLFLRKAVWPLREVISGMQREDLPFISRSVRVFLRDVYDHTVQIVETIEVYRDMASGMIELYLSSASNRLNEVMKVLTIIATIFIPLTFICSIYGMNFEYMPELKSPYGYPGVLAFMLVVAVFMIGFFRRRRWL